MCATTLGHGERPPDSAKRTTGGGTATRASISCLLRAVNNLPREQVRRPSASVCWREWWGARGEGYGARRSRRDRARATLAGDVLRHFENKQRASSRVRTAVDELTAGCARPLPTPRRLRARRCGQPLERALARIRAMASQPGPRTRHDRGGQRGPEAWKRRAGCLERFGESSMSKCERARARRLPDPRFAVRALVARSARSSRA